MGDYRVEERSLVGPYLQRFLVKPLLVRLPASLSANSITLFANVCSAASIALAAASGPYQGPRFVLAAIAVLVYVVLDNADGAHARRTGRSSPFGEFLDHWLDTFNGAWLSLGGSLVLGVSVRGTILLLAGAQVSFFASMWEQRLTGKLVIGRINQIEACVCIGALELVEAFVGRAWTHMPLVLGISLERFFILLQIGVFVSVIAGALYRSWRSANARSWASLFTNWAVVAVECAWIFTAHVDSGWLVAVLVLVGVVTSGRMVIARLLKRATPIADPLHGLLAVGGLVASFANAQVVELRLVQLLVGWLAIGVIYDARLAIGALRCHLRRDELLGRLFTA